MDIITLIQYIGICIISVPILLISTILFFIIIPYIVGEFVYRIIFKMNDDNAHRYVYRLEPSMILFGYFIIGICILFLTFIIQHIQIV